MARTHLLRPTAARPRPHAPEGEPHRLTGSRSGQRIETVRGKDPIKLSVAAYAVPRSARHSEQDTARKLEPAFAMNLTTGLATCVAR